MRAFTHHFRARFATAAGFLLACIASAFAQMPLPNPDLDLVGSGSVLAMVRDAGGKLIIGGNFESVNGVERHNLARFELDGTLDQTWHPSANSWVTALAATPGGDLYIGGYFSSVNGIPRQGMAKLDIAGAIDPSWMHDIAGVTAIVADSNGDVYAADSSTQSYAGIFKLSGIDGNNLLWTSSWEHADYLVLDGQGSLYAGLRQFQAEFPSTIYRASITRRSAATGEVDATWSPDLIGNYNDYLYTIATDGDAIYAGGTFGLRKFLASTGSDASGWNAPAANIATIALDATGPLYVGGPFESIHGQAHGHIALLSRGTGLPLPWWNSSSDSDVTLVTADQSYGVDIAGSFQSFNTVQRIGLAHVDSFGTLSTWQTDVELPSTAFVLAAQSDGGVIVGGRFHRVGALPHRNILRLRPDGMLDNDWNPSLPLMPWVLAAAPDGGVYAAMNRWVASEQGSSTLARIDPIGHLIADWSISSDRWINAMAVGADGALFVGGDYSMIGGASRQSLAKIDAKSSVPLPGWDAHIDCCSVEAIELGEGDSIFVGGTFKAVDGAPRGGLAKLSGESALVDPQWAPDTGGGNIYTIALDHAESLYAGGQFFSVNGELHPLISKLRVNGSGETVPGWYTDFHWGMNGQFNNVWRLVVDANGTVYAAGFFSVDPFSNERTFVKLSGENGLIDDHWGPIAWYDSPYDLAVSLSGSIYVSGSFQQAYGSPRLGLAAFAPILPDRFFLDGFDDHYY